MIKIVLADDEKLIRAGLKKILLENLDVPLDITEAKNGEEALRLCQEKHPAILITDIRMPMMDGLELMRRVCQMDDKPAIIVLSAYDDFSYAKTAISRGAISYILKPVDKKELISVVNSAIIDSNRKEKIRNEQKLRQIFKTGRIDGMKSLPEITVKNSLHCMAIYGKNAAAMVESVMGARRYYSLEQTRSGICIVYPFDGAEIVFDFPILNDYIVGVSGSANDYSMLRTLSKQAITAAMQSFFNPLNGLAWADEKKGGIYYYDDAEHVCDFTEIDENYARMISRLDIADANQVNSDVETLFCEFGFDNPSETFGFVAPLSSQSAKLSAEKLHYIFCKITQDMFMRYPSLKNQDMYLHLKSMMLESVFEMRNFAEWKSLVRDYAVYLAALLKKDRKESPYITEALEYIKSNFTKNINMAIVANQVSVNYTWFSEKFKEHTGVNFNDYLRRLRMEEAKKLLAKGLYKVYEVAERVGYRDVKYFMRHFKADTGLSPTEYSNKHRTI